MDSINPTPAEPDATSTTAQAQFAPPEPEPTDEVAPAPSEAPTVPLAAPVVAPVELVAPSPAPAPLAWTPGGIAPTVGRIVNCVLPAGHRRAGEIRPAIVARVNQTSVNLDVFLDGPNDSSDIERLDVGWFGSAPYDESAKPGTWHWAPDSSNEWAGAQVYMNAHNKLRDDHQLLLSIVTHLAANPGIKINVRDISDIKLVPWR